MSLDRLVIRDFRNYEHLVWDLSPGFNLVVGKNAQGKTNLMEAIYMLGTAKRLRGMKDPEVVREGAEFTEIRGTLDQSRTEVTLIVGSGRIKKAKINNQFLPRAADLLGRVPVVAFSASDLPIVRGEPSERRAFLDLQLSQVYPRYLTEFSKYKNALTQRNALLKQAQSDSVESDLFWPWENTLAEAGASISLIRENFLQAIEEELVKRHAQLGSGESISLRLESAIIGLDQDEIRVKLADTRSADIARGSTSIGPHRDELVLEVQGKEARRYGSQGQQRTAVIALKLAVFHFMSEEKGAPPILLLDDIFSDLDQDRRQKLIEIVSQEAGQVVLTCTDAAQAGAELESGANRIVIENGRIKNEKTL